MKKLPAIILTSQFSTPASRKKYGKYVGYMARKDALESKEYLNDDEKKELNRVNKLIHDINLKNHFDSFKKEEISKREKKAEKIIQEKEFYDLNDSEFDKYLGYMVRKDALLKKENLTEKEKIELKRIDTAAKKIGEVRPTKEKVLDGVFTSEKNIVQLKDMDYIRQQLNIAQKNNSVLWQDVVSFDNKFLKRKKILDPETGILNEEEIQKATRDMQNVFQKEMDPPLNQMFWVASLHRNTDNVHIHIATVEREPQRPIIERNGELQPKGRRKQSTIDRMKSTFANSLLGTNKLTIELSKERQRTRKIVQSTLKEQVYEQNFQIQINQFMRELPTSRREWQYNKLNDQQKNKLNAIVDFLLDDNEDFKNFKKNVLEMQKDREELFGKSKRDNKNYAINQLFGKEGIYARNGNALLHDLRELDKKANDNQRHRKNHNLKDIVSADNYIQEVLRKIEVNEFRKEIESKKLESKQKEYKPKKRKKIHRFPVITKGRLRKLKSNQEKVFEKTHADFKTRKALLEYQRMQEKIQEELEE